MRHGAWTQNFGTEHTKNHSDMRDDEEESDEKCMPLHFSGIIEMATDESELQECDTAKWYDTKEIEHYSDDIGWSAPSSRSSERDDGACHQVEKNWNKIYSGSDACIATDFSHGTTKVSGEE